MDELLAGGQEVGVYWQDGRPFHGKYSIRMNLALPKSRVEEALRRLKEYVLKYGVQKEHEKRNCNSKLWNNLSGDKT